MGQRQRSGPQIHATGACPPGEVAGALRASRRDTSNSDHRSRSSFKAEPGLLSTAVGGIPGSSIPADAEVGNATGQAVHGRIHSQPDAPSPDGILAPLTRECSELQLRSSREAVSLPTNSADRAPGCKAGVQR